MGSKGKRGCSLKLSFILHLVALVTLLVGTCSPYWSRVYDDTSGDVIMYTGLVVNRSPAPANELTLRDFNVFKQATSDQAILYLTLATVFALGGCFLQFFLVQAYAFAACNASCGAKYNPDCLMIFSLLSGAVGVTSLILFEQYQGRSASDTDSSLNFKMDYSRGFVIVSVALEFLAAFFTVCDRTSARNKVDKA